MFWYVLVVSTRDTCCGSSKASQLVLDAPAGANVDALHLDWSHNDHYCWYAYRLYKMLMHTHWTHLYVKMTRAVMLLCTCDRCLTSQGSDVLIQAGTVPLELAFDPNIGVETAVNCGTGLV